MAAPPAAAGGRCVDTPSEYQAAWQARQVRCVAPTLFATAHGRGDGSLYPAGFAYAWAGSSTNLEAYLRLRHRYGDEPAKVGVGILSYVGFPGLETWSFPMDLAVYTLPRGVDAPVPTFERWFRLLDDQVRFRAAGVARPRAGVRAARPHAGRRRRLRSTSPAARRADLLAGAFPGPDIGCDKDFLDALTAAGPSPYEGAESTRCFANFDAALCGPA